MNTVASTKGSNLQESSWDSLVQTDRVHRTVYTDEHIFAQEMDHVFGGTWVYLLHESEIANPNDFRQAWIGTREVVVTRDEDNAIHVFFNRCSHRGATVCRQHQGNVSTFTCGYHGWRFDNRGQLFGIPGKNAYGPTFKSRDMNLARPALVASYKGFVFATLNPNAQALVAHLGSAARYLDEWIEHQGGPDNIIVSGAQRYRLECNWKLIWDNAGDGYHVPFSHQSLLLMTQQRYGGGDMSYFADADRTKMRAYALDNGHTLVDQRPEMHATSAWAGQRPQPGREPFEEHVFATARPDRAEAILRSAVGAGMNFNIFPNLALLGNQMQVIQPLKVGVTAMHWYATQRRDGDAELNTIRMRTQEDFPIMGEMDDNINFEECQRGLTNNPEDEWVDIGRHSETGQDIIGEDGTLTGPVTSDLHQRNYYAQWKRLMKATPELRAYKGNLK